MYYISNANTKTNKQKEVKLLEKEIIKNKNIKTLPSTVAATLIQKEQHLSPATEFKPGMKSWRAGKRKFPDNILLEIVKKYEIEGYTHSEIVNEYNINPSYSKRTIRNYRLGIWKLGNLT